MFKYVKHADPRYGTIEVGLNCFNKMYAFEQWGEFTIPATFRVRNIVTNCVHEVERITITDARSNHPRSRGRARYKFICPTIVGLEKYVITTEPVSCKVCIKTNK